MHHRALGRAVRAGTFGALAVAVTTISLVPAAGAARGRPAMADSLVAGPATSDRPAAGADATAGAGATPGRRALAINGDQILVRQAAGGTGFRYITQASSRVSDPAARPAVAPMHTLTVKGTNLAGKPDTGDSVLVVNVDNTKTLDPLQSQQRFRHGVAKFTVPAGHYFAIGGFGSVKIQGHPGPATRYVVLPQFTVTGNTAVTMHETAADSKVTMVTPRPATVLSSDLWLRRTGASGPPLVLELYPLGHPVWISPTHAKPTVGTLQVSVNQHLESPPGRKVPYEYTLSYTSPPGTISAQHYVVAAKDLATVHERFYQPARSSGEWAFNGSFPAASAANRNWFGFIEPAGPALKFPGQLTEYAGGTGSADMEWFGQYEPFPRTPFLAGDVRLLSPGKQLTENWDAYPLHPAANALLTTEPNMFSAIQPSAVRAGNTLSLDLDPFDDNQPGHDIGFLDQESTATITGSYQIDQNGTKIAAGNPVTATDPGGEFYTQATLGAKPSTIRFSLALTRTDPHFPLSTATRTVWQWHSAPVTGAKLPRGWSCAPLKRIRDCSVEPMMTLWYAVAGLRLNGTVPPGRQVVRVTAGHLQLAAAAKITHASVSVSFDGGKTWHAARVTGHDGSYAAAFTAPAGARVTLRTKAADAADGSVSEIVTSAYQIAG